MPAFSRLSWNPLAAMRVLRHVLAHWREERRTLRQGFTALGICIGVTMVAGVTLGAMDELLAEVPGLLVLVPAAIGMRGAIFGALGARLGTGILTGQYTTGWERGAFTTQNVEAAGLLSVVTAALSAVVAWGAAALFGLPTVGIPQLTILSMTGALVSSAVVLAVTLALSRTAQARSWDMDAIGMPVISATADLSTLPALILGTMLLINPVAEGILGGLLLAASAWTLWLGLRHPGDLARRIFRESLPVLGYAAIMGVFAGTILSTRLEALVTSPALLVAIPPFIAGGGALGGILSARLSSKLHLGLLAPQRLPDNSAALEGSLTVAWAIVGFAGVGALTQLASVIVGFDSPGLLPLVGATLVGGALATGALFFVAYYAATASYRFGLDPDNSSIPIVTATMDFLGIICFITGVSFVGGMT